MPTIIYERCGEKVIRLTQCQDCDTTILLQQGKCGLHATRCATCRAKRKRVRERNYYLMSKVKREAK